MSDPSAPAPDPNRLRNAFANVSPDNHGGVWDNLWQESFTPWDRGGPSFALEEAILSPNTEYLFNHHVQQRQQQQGSSASKPTALVPGCGQGHDALLVAALGYDVKGLDVSPEATKNARENEDKNRHVVDGMLKGKALLAGKRGTVEWITGSFWEDDWLQVGGRTFDLIFDYTFLCALPPSERPRWASRMSQLLKRNGRLVCLEWPHLGTDKDPKIGPPYVLTPELYCVLLARPGEEPQYGDDGLVLVRDDVQIPIAANGLKRLEHLTPSETHQTGKDANGKVLDRVSVWAHITPP